MRSEGRKKDCRDSLCKHFESREEQLSISSSEELWTKQERKIQPMQSDTTRFTADVIDQTVGSCLLDGNAKIKGVFQRSEESHSILDSKGTVREHSKEFDEVTHTFDPGSAYDLSVGGELTESRAESGLLTVLDYRGDGSLRFGAVEADRAVHLNLKFAPGTGELKEVLATSSDPIVLAVHFDVDGNGQIVAVPGVDVSGPYEAIQSIAAGLPLNPMWPEFAE